MNPGQQHNKAANTKYAQKKVEPITNALDEERMRAVTRTLLICAKYTRVPTYRSEKTPNRVAFA